MEPAVRVELTTNGLQIRCSATELRRLKSKGGLCEYWIQSQLSEESFSAFFMISPEIDDFHFIVLFKRRTNGTD